MSGFNLTPLQYETLLSPEYQNCKYFLAEGGARSAKTTFIIADMLLTAMKFPYSTQLIVREHLREVKASIMMGTIPKTSRLIGKGFGKMVSKALNKSDFVYTFPNGSEIWLGGLGNEDQIDKILGTEFSKIFFNEISQMCYPVVETVLSRLAQNIEGLRTKAMFDTNPTFKSHWGYKLFHEHLNPTDNLALKKPHLYGYRVLNPRDNPHLSEDYIEDVLGSMSERQRKRFEYGEWLSEVAGALWTLALIEENRVPYPPSSYERVVIGVDPATTANKRSDETGIVVAGLNGKLAYVLADESGKYSPEEWATLIRDLFFEFDAHAIIVEDNAGGDLIETNIEVAFPNAPIIRVHAHSGKALRAEPIKHLYEKSLVKHVSHLPGLEDEMVSHVFTGPTASKTSPNRIDALVYAIWELCIAGHISMTRTY